MTAVAKAVADQLGIGTETVCRWVVQADIDAGDRPGTSSEESAEIRKLKAENRRLREDNETCGGPRCSSPGSSTPATADHVRHRGNESRGSRRRVDLRGAHQARLSGRGTDLPGLATGHRSVAARTVSDEVVIDALLATRGTPEGLYGRRKMTVHLRRRGLVVAQCTVDRLMRDPGMNGVRRGKKLRTTIPGRDGHRAGDSLDRDSTAAAPNIRWVADFTYVRTRAGFAYLAFVVDVFARRIVAWHAATTKVTDLVLTPLRIAMWDRDRHGHPIEPGTLVCHSDAGGQYTSLRYTERLALEGIAPSIGTVGDAYDNGLMESIIGL